MKSSVDYSHQDIYRAYQSMGVSAGKVVYVTGNLGALGKFSQNNKNEILNAHFSILMDLIGEKGTLVVPTHSWSLCNTITPFDPEKTLSETGAFSEFVRRQDGAIRQFHPFSSVTAIGHDALNICSDNSRHAYGPNSPFERMIDAEAIYLVVGRPINMAVSVVHHAEMVMGVPYRYAKEFIHPCIVRGEQILVNFYLYVLRRDVDIIRDRNKKILEFYLKNNNLLCGRLGRSTVQAVRIDEFYKSSVNLLSRDIYAWLKVPPTKRSSYQE